MPNPVKGRKLKTVNAGGRKAGRLDRVRQYADRLAELDSRGTRGPHIPTGKVMPRPGRLTPAPIQTRPYPGPGTPGAPMPMPGRQSIPPVYAGNDPSGGRGTRGGPSSVPGSGLTPRPPARSAPMAGRSPLRPPTGPKPR